MTGASQHTSNIVIGSGEIFIDLLVDGAYTGERYLGDSVGASLSIAIERTQIFSGDGPVSKRLVDQVRQVTHTLACTAQDVSAENLALFVVGDASTRQQAAVAVADETFQVRKGRWYQLGASASNPGGVSAIAAAGVAVSVGATAAAATAAAAIAAGSIAANYFVSADHGRLYVLPGAPDIADDHYLSVDYTPVARDLEDVKVTASRSIEGAFRYVESADLPGSGRGRNIYARLCSVSGSGELNLKARDANQQIALTIEVQEPAGDWPSLAIDGVAV